VAWGERYARFHCTTKIHLASVDSSDLFVFGCYALLLLLFTTHLRPGGKLGGKMFNL